MSPGYVDISDDEVDGEDLDFTLHESIVNEVPPSAASELVGPPSAIEPPSAVPELANASSLSMVPPSATPRRTRPPSAIEPPSAVPELAGASSIIDVTPPSAAEPQSILAGPSSIPVKDKGKGPAKKRTRERMTAALTTAAARAAAKLAAKAAFPLGRKPAKKQQKLNNDDGDIIGFFETKVNFYAFKIFFFYGRVIRRVERRYERVISELWLSCCFGRLL